MFDFYPKLSLNFNFNFRSKPSYVLSVELVFKNVYEKITELENNIEVRSNETIILEEISSLSYIVTLISNLTVSFVEDYFPTISLNNAAGFYRNLNASDILVTC